MKTNPEYPLKVIIADDHPFFRDGFQIALKKISGISKISHAADGQQVLQILSKEPHNIVFMDVKMPSMNGIEATKKIAKKYPDVKVIALSMYDDLKNIIEMINSGAAGYVIKNTDKKEIEKAIAYVMDGKNYFSPGLSGELFQKLVSKQKQQATLEDIEFLTEREKQILRLICRQLTTEEISEKLYIAVKTVETHRADLFYKTKAKNVAGLVLWAIRNGYCDEI